MSKSSTNILNNNNSGKMTPEINDQIKQKVLRSLEGTRYAVGSLEPLSGGIANFMYRGDLLEPLEDGVTKVAIKHGEGFVATNSSFKLPLDRCVCDSLPTS